MQNLFNVSTQDQMKITTIFLPNDHVRKTPSTKTGLHLAEKDAAKQVPACNRRRRFCRAIHQLMPEHFKTTHNLQGRCQKVEQRVLRQSWQCQFALQNSRELRQQCKELHNSTAGAEKPVCSELFSLQLFLNSFFLTLNFHTFVMSPRASFLEKSQHN